MVNPAKPPYVDNEDFITDFDNVPGPGFYPGAGGYFHRCSGSTCRIAIFGTDFGTTKYWREVRTRGCETEIQPTIKPLRELIDEVAQETGVRGLASWCYLTNAVLAVAKCTNEVHGNGDTHKAYRKLDCTSYLRECGETHAQWLREQKPSLAVLLGAKHVEVYGCSVWSVVWPDLFGPGGRWVGVPMKEALRSPVAAAETGLRVQLMYHPSSRKHWHDARKQAKDALVGEVRSLAKSAGRRVR